MRRPSSIATDTDGLLLGNVAIGARIGDYQIEGRLTGRGTGLVYEASHVVLPRRAAIKVMPASDNLASGMELMREGCIIEALDHPGIPRLFECGILPDRRAWIATELILGTSLADVADSEPMTLLDVAAMMRDVAEILDHAHRRGLVHCNLLPTTIVVPLQVRRFPLCVVEWSGARTYDATSPVPMLRSGAAIPYAAPEQLHGGAIDGRADIYALGVIAYQMLHNSLPATAIAPSRDVPPVLTRLIAQMSAFDPAKRPSAGRVHAVAAWLIDTLEPELRAIPGSIDDATTRPVDDSKGPRRSGVITSELVAQVSGEIESGTASDTEAPSGSEPAVTR